jgi:2',3'-cyclic-nucleotide 2'-phosphodiesterase (5'-nucleotidase family)
MMIRIKPLFIALTLLSLNLAHAKLIQIIHTNDLHSMFTGSRSGKGGYARIKTIIDGLKQSSQKQGIPTLVLDAGDFGEGSSFYYSNKGVDALRALDLLGTDVTILGNHDFMMGGTELSQQIQEAGLKAHILSANLRGKRLMGLHKLMPNYVDLKIDQIKVRIFGLTTNEFHYQYPLFPNGYIGSSHKTGLRMAKKAEKDDVDILIALTHIGVNNDKLLVAETSNINLIVGGHSHTRLDQPLWTPNLENKMIPIVQTGAHGMAVGSVLIDIQEKGLSKLIDYRLYDVEQSITEDEKVKSFVDSAYINREKYFNRKWNEVIGFSHIPLTGY